MSDRQIFALILLVLAAVFDIYGLWPTRNQSALCAAGSDESAPFVLAGFLLIVVSGILRPRFGGWMWLAYGAGTLALLWRLTAGLGCIG
jgi:hypothetical protein